MAQQLKPVACSTIPAMASLIEPIIVLLLSNRLTRRHLLRLPKRTAGWSICVPLHSTEPALLYCASVPVHRPLPAQALPLPLLECGTGLHRASGSGQTDGYGRCIAKALSLGGRRLSSHHHTDPHMDL